MLIKLDDQQLGWMAASRARVTADIGGHPLIAAEAARNLAVLARKAGWPAQALSIALTAADHPGLRSGGPSHTAQRGLLIQSAAYTVARSGDQQGMRELTDQAAAIAAELGGATLLRDHGGGFNPTTVQLHRISAENSAGDPSAAIAAARKVPPQTLPTVERRARYYTDLATAFGQWGRRDDCIHALLAAERQAPEETHTRPAVRLGVSGQSNRSPILDDVERRDFLGGATGLAVTVLLPRDVATPGRIDANQAAQCWTALQRLFELDDRQGGAVIYQVAEEMARRLQESLRRGSYVSSVGRDRQRVTTATMEHAGWLAYDAGWQQKARHWWLETCHLAELADIPDARVTALASMALQASSTPGGGRETVELAHAARVAAGDQATPVLLSLLAAREAVGHAQAGDRNAAVFAIGQSHQWLDQGRRGDEPFWLDFWGPADLAAHEVMVALATGQDKLAEVAARRALASVDAESFPRNHVSYTSHLGLVLIRSRQLDEAITVTSNAVQQVDKVRGSGRIVARLNRAVDLLGQQNYPPAKTFAAAAHRLLPVSR